MGKTMMTTAATLLALCATGLGAQEADFRWSQQMRAGEYLDVRGIAGSIRAERAPDGRAEVVATKDGRRGDFADVEIRVEEGPDGYTVCAVYHVRDRQGDRCDHRWDDGDRHRNRSIDVEVDFVVRVPAGVAFHGSMVSGDVAARDLASDVEANTVNGDISVSTTGKARGNTVSGSIEIDMGSTDWRDLDFHTVSGDITLWLPDGIRTDVDFESLSGDLRSDFDITTTGRRKHRWVGSEMEGYIGTRGERSLSFNTVSGDVRLRRAR